MKKILFLLIISLFALQACTVDSVVTYHPDAASTTLANVDLKEAMETIKSMIPDSLKNKQPDLGDFEKVPQKWTSFYKMEKKKGNLKTKNPDSIRVMKKVFVKSTFQDKQITNFSMKLDHFTKADYKVLTRFSKEEKLPVDQMAMNSWDGKTLTIDTENLNVDGVKNLLGKGYSSPDAKISLGTVKLLFKKIGTTLRFEKKIKSITGKHDWISQIDDYSVKINYDLDDLLNESPIKKPIVNADKQIVIVTE